MDDLCLDFLWSANPWHNLLKRNNSCVIFLSKLQHFQIKSRNQNSHKDHEFSKMFNNPPRVVIWQIPGQSNRTLNSCFRRKDELCREDKTRLKQKRKWFLIISTSCSCRSVSCAILNVKDEGKWSRADIFGKLVNVAFGVSEYLTIFASHAHGRVEKCNHLGNCFN